MGQYTCNKNTQLLNNYAAYNYFVKNNVIIDRKEELAFLNGLYNSNRAELIILYGRRRIGKTFLLNHFSETRNAIYYLATKESETVQARELSNRIAKFYKDDALSINPFSSYSQIFEYLAKKTIARTLLIIDEFGYIMETSPYISSVLQKYWDEGMNQSKIFIILNGSIIAVMESLLSIKNSLYGRRTGQWHMKVLSFVEFYDFLKSKEFTDIAQCWALTGGIIFYAKEFMDYKSIKEFVMKTFFNRGHAFYEEGRIIVSDEFGETQTYFSILSGIAKGITKSNDLSNFIGIKNTSLSSYMRSLIEIGFVERIVPVTDPENSKKTRYFIKDNFLRFWFSFVYPNKNLVEINKFYEIENDIKKRFPVFMGRAFEMLVRENVGEFINMNFDKIGTWWGRNPEKPKGFNEEEIDIVAINNKTGNILFAECKWTNSDVGTGVYSDLKRKSKLVQWHNDSRKEYYAIFSKSGFTDEMKKVAGEEDTRLFDLREMENTIAGGDSS